MPKKGTIMFKAGQTLKAGSNESINIKLWEGNISSPIDDNRFIDVLKIAGTDFDSGVIPTGAEIECEYEMSDSGTISIEASIPCIGASFSNRNFYSRQEGQIDLTDIDTLAEQGRSVLDRVETMSKKIADPNLEQARAKAERAANLDSQPDCEPEDVQKANNDLLDAKKIINKARMNNLKMMRQLDLDDYVDFFNEAIRQYATPAEIQTFESLVRTAQKSIDRNDTDFDNILDTLKSNGTFVLIRQDWFIVDWYKRITVSSANYVDKTRFAELKRLGDRALAEDDMGQLRTVLSELLKIRIYADSGEGMYDTANIIKG